MNDFSSSLTSRREFIKTTGRLAAASALAGVAIPHVHAAGSDLIQVALIGCGGRGTGAASNALSTKQQGPIKLVAMADVFENRLSESYDTIKKQCGEQVDVPQDRKFIGFDGYKKAMDCLKPGDIAIFTTPLAFRWVHFTYAIEKNLHVFMEKPLTADGPTSRRLIKLAEDATAKNLKAGVGLMSRHSRSLQELQQRIQDGEIGDVILMRGYRMHGPVGSAFSTKWPGNPSELMWQIQRFHSFIWASGGCYSDFYIHHIDHLCWMKNAWPVKAQALGGRNYRFDPEGKPYIDQNFDAYAVEYTFDDGSKMTMDGRCMNGCNDIYSSYAHGSKGMAIVAKANDCGFPSSIYKGQSPHRADQLWVSKEIPGQQDPYENEWNDLIDAIRNDKPYSEVKRGVQASLATSMGRMAAHTGQEISFDDMLNNEHEYAPGVDKLTFESAAPLVADKDGKYPIPMPGITKQTRYRYTLLGTAPLPFPVHWRRALGFGRAALRGVLLAWLAVASQACAQLPSSGSNSFGIYRELWTGLTQGGNALGMLTNTANNPRWPNNPDPSFTRVFTNFETEINTGMNYYGQRLRTYVIPPTNGTFVFWIASDDASALYLSSDERPSNKKEIAWVNGWTSPREWSKEPNQQSAPVYLERGCRYYLEALMQQGSGGDNLAVRWQLPDFSLEEPLASFGASGTLLIPFTGQESPPALSPQTTNVTVVEGANAAFSVLVTNQAPVTYQWSMNGIALSGNLARKPFYTVTNVSLSTDNGQVYLCSVSNSFGTVMSAPIVLKVLPDLAPPQIVRVLNVGTSSVQVVFSEAVEPASATNAINFVFTNGLTIANIALAADGASVLLSTPPLVFGSNYVLVVNSVRDRAANPNVIASNTAASFTALPYTPSDIGNPATASSTSFVTNGADVVAAGADIGGAADQFALNYQVRSGDFDIAVRVRGFNAQDPFAKAGLMAREGLNSGSRFAAILATPAMAGAVFEWRDPAFAQARSTGRFPPNFPNVWLRLKRSGQTFTGFAGYDGQSWVELGRANIVMPAALYIGLAASSHNSQQPCGVQFRDIQEVASAEVVAFNSPHEPLGPCSRRTPLVISEIMYKPSPRADGNNIEFVELYNSNPYSEDISGWQLTGGSISYTFGPGTLLGGGAFLVVAASPASMARVYGITNVVGPYAGSLKTFGTLRLVDEQAAVLLSLTYSSAAPWPVAANGAGHSLVLANPTYGEADPRAWDISDVMGGSPGAGESFRPSPLRAVTINEILAHSESGSVLQFIELYNHSNRTNDLSGCVLTDDPVIKKCVLPSGTLILPRGFLAVDRVQLGFVPDAGGGTVLLVNPDGSRVLDVVSYEGQADGISFGRFPDGAASFYPLSVVTAGSNNAVPAIGKVVINELMYAPISGNDDDQYIELYNRGANPVNLAGWQFTAGANFTFPPNQVLAPDGYLVIARNVTNLLAHYPNLNAVNTIGNFGGKLAHQGERLALAAPQFRTQSGPQGVVTNTIYVVEDEVTYEPGGRWGQWSHGGGSSLELINPAVDHRLAYNWADSDETRKSAWTNLEFTGVLDNGGNYGNGSVNEVQVGLLESGECLVDDLEVHSGGPAGINIVSNGTFETGLSGWTLQGDHVRSSLETVLGGYQSGASLHLRASDSLWTLANYAQGALTSTTLGAGQQATLRLKARWLRGWPEILMRLRGNWLELAGRLPVPLNLGTPGQPNSCFRPDAGTAIYEVKHAPSLPAAGQPIVVSARFRDPNPFQALLRYRIDTGVNPAPVYRSITMVDNGVGGDAIAGDGVYSATLPGQTAGTVVAFLVQASNELGTVTFFPSDLRDNAGVPRECVVGFGDAIPSGSFSHHHIFLTQNWAQRWARGGGVSHELHDGTWIDGGGRIIYNWAGRYAGSPYHQYLGSPITTVGGMHWNVPADEPLFGTTSLNKQHVPGNGPLDDDTLQREQTAFWMAHQIGLRRQNRRYYFCYVNGNRHAPVMEDAQVPDGDMVNEYWPDDSNGWLFKNHVWFEGDLVQQPNGYMDFNGMSGCVLGKFTTPVNGVNQYKLARYRWMWLIRQYPESANDFSELFALMDAANTPPTGPAYYANMESQIDTEEWVRMSAMEHATGDWDSFLSLDSWNMFSYKPTLGKWTVLKWDWNILMGTSGSWGPDGSQLFNLGPGDPVMATFLNDPPYLRAYLRALQDIADLAMNNARVDPLLDAKYAAFAANGLTASSAFGIQVREPGASGLKSWIGTMHHSILAALANRGVANVSFSVNSPVVSSDVAVISGTAPLAVKTLQFNGVEWPVTWTGLTSWRVTVPLNPGTNTFKIVGVDLKGRPVANATNNTTVIFNTEVPSPAGLIVINEIMYAPPLAGAQYVELYNSSGSASFDLSGWELRGLNYTFPPGALLGPGRFFVLGANRSAFSAAYGGAIPLFDVFDGALAPSGQNLLLVSPGATSSNELLVAGVRYGNRAPWPAGADGLGSSLQLIDPRQDNWRAGNWSGIYPPRRFSPGALNIGRTSLPDFPPLFLNEVQPENVNGITNSLGQHAGWVELFNVGSNAVSLDGLYLAGNATNLTAWPFPSDAVIGPNQFLVVFVDGQTNLSTAGELHANFTLPPGDGLVLLCRLYNAQPQVLDYLEYAHLTPNQSFGSVPEGQPFFRQNLAFATPGHFNDSTDTLSFIPYTAASAIYTQEFDSLLNPGFDSINADNPVTISGTTYALANPLELAAPVSSLPGNGGLALSDLAGWYALADVAVKLGATAGDQTTGGLLSYGLPNSSNRALGLQATSSTGGTAFGVKFVNATDRTFTWLNVECTGEIWRQSNVPKELRCYYFVDPTSRAFFPRNATAYLPALDVRFPAAPAAQGGVPVIGTLPGNQTNLSVVEAPIVDWTPQSALWLVWQMADSSGKAQGLAIDHLRFSASNASTVNPVPLTLQVSGNNVLISWPAANGATYQIEVENDLVANTWTPLGPPVRGNGKPVVLTDGLTLGEQRFYRLRILP